MQRVGMEAPDPAFRVRRWRWVTIAAGAVLVLTFFLPIRGCDLTLGQTPLQLLREILPSSFSYKRVLRLVLGLWVAGLPHWVGGLMALEAVGAMTGRNVLRRAAHWTGVAVGLGLAGVTVGMLVFLLIDAWGHGFLTLDPMGVLVHAVTLLGILAIGHALLAMCRGRMACLYHGAAGAVWLVVLLALWMGMAREFRGVGPATTVSALLILAVSRMGEARATTGLSWGHTVQGLVLLRLPESPPSGVCVGCGYDLRGLPEPRCPECGRAFTPNAGIVAERSADTATG